MTKRTPLEMVQEAFVARFGAPPVLVAKAPGRVNLIGEHTDYNEGFVLPMAINFAVWLALRPRPDRRVVMHSLNFQETNQFSLDMLRREDTGWLEYVKGMVWAWSSEGVHLPGFDGVMFGDIPNGAGLSSSAAVEMATGRAFCALTGREWDPVAIARMGQRVENQWLGLKSGIMDQLISAAGVADHALLIDCRSLAARAVPIPRTPAGNPVAVVVLDTGTRRGLVDSAYNQRRAQCEEAAQIMSVPALRDADWQTYHRFVPFMPDKVRLRARHVISENERTLQATIAMEQNDVHQLGALMNAGHASLRDDYAVSSSELNVMVGIAQKQAGCYGARMTGAGFGGCAVALVDESAAGAFAEAVAASYTETTRLASQVLVCKAESGAQIVAVSGDHQKPGANSA